MHRGNAFGEAVDEVAVGAIFAPHQPLHDPRDPHRGGVENDADGREPEVPVDHTQAVEARSAPQTRDEVIEAGEGDHAVPAERARMDVADGPVGVVRHGIDPFDRHHRAFEGAHAIEGERHHHHADDRVGADLVPRAVQRHQAVDHAAPARHPQHDRKDHAQRLRPVGQRGVVQMVRTRPDIEEDQRPEVDDRQAIAVDGAFGLLGHEIIHHRQEAGGQEEADRIMAVPPLGQRILDAREGGVAL